MKAHYRIAFVLVLIIGCNEPFSKIPEAALAVPCKMEQPRESVVFITGFDEGENAYYTSAETYFSEQGIRIVNDLFSLEEIITWINREGAGQTNFDEIHIVSHSNAWLGMALKTTNHGQRIRLKTLLDVRKHKKIPALNKGVDGDTKIIFHSCGLGEHMALLQELKSIFTTTGSPTLYASSYFNVFGGKFAAHYLAKPYYVYYPTAESPGPARLSKEFTTAYPDINIDWFAAIKTRRETVLGGSYSFKFNIPIEWEFAFETATEVPILDDREAIMDWVSESPEMSEVLLELNIPLEKYRWRTEIEGRKLRIKGKTTVLSVLAPILQDADKQEYRVAKLNDRSIYQKV